MASLNEKQLEYRRQQQMYAQDATPRADLESAEAAYKQPKHKSKH